MDTPMAQRYLEILAQQNQAPPPDQAANLH